MDQEFIEYEKWKFWLYVVQLLATGGLMLYVYITNKSKVNKDHIIAVDEHHKKESEQIKERLTRVEERIPKDIKEDFLLVHDRLNTLSGEQHVLAGEFKQVSEALKRLHDYMINK